MFAEIQFDRQLVEQLPDQRIQVHGNGDQHKQSVLHEVVPVEGDHQQQHKHINSETPVWVPKIELLIEDIRTQ